MADIRHQLVIKTSAEKFTMLSLPRKDFPTGVQANYRQTGGRIYEHICFWEIPKRNESNKPCPKQRGRMGMY